MDWAYDEDSVKQLCNKLVQKHGIVATNQVLAGFKRLDAHEVLDLDEYNDRDFRKRIRHLCKAFYMTPTKQTVVPGVAPVAKAFKKPEECILKLAKVIKPLLLAAAEMELQRAEAAATQTSKSPAERQEPAEQEEISEARLQLQRDIMAGSFDDEPEASQPSQQEQQDELSGGIMSLSEYKDLREREVHEGQKRRRSAEDREEVAPVKSLMDLRKEGVFKHNEAEVKRYELMRRHEADMWGKSKREQERHQLKKQRLANKTEAQDSDGEPWVRFDREKVFGAATKGMSGAQFNELMEATAENAALFKKAS